MDGKEPSLRAAGPVQGWTLFAGCGGPVNPKGGNSETATERLAIETFHDQVPCIGTGEITIT